MNAIAHELTWVAAAPLWNERVKDRALLRRPALLQFKSDAFMEQLFGELEQEPAKVGDRVLEPGPDGSLKLFQPIHGHYHLVAASLVCQVPGLPDHPVDPAREERAELVLRRLAGNVELAWVPGADASSPGAWRPVADPEAVEEGEELLPLFPGAFFEEGGMRRRLYFGLVPTSSGETFLAAEVTATSQLTDDGETVLKADAPALVPKLGARAGAEFVIRCVYRRPRCIKEKPLLSDPTERFSIAPYFDPDAPARPVRIAMPLSFADLKRAKQNVGIVLSDEIREKLASLTFGVFKKEEGGDPIAPNMSGSLGKICSLSIPVVTIVAMMILMIVVSLLEIIFKWMSWPIVACLPVNLKAKE